jgi:hypothetical protein
MIDSGSIQYNECKERLTNLYLDSNHWLIKHAIKISKNFMSICIRSVIQRYFGVMHTICFIVIVF